jgi:6-phosphofructokinase 1
VGVPKTIDNDLNATDRTFGFDSAVSCVAEALDRIHSTAMSHHRIMVIETMGRYAGWIALHGGMAGGADVILIPEIPYEVEEVVKVCQERYRSGKKFTLIAIAEGAAPKGGTIAVQKVVKESTDPVRLGGAGYRLADDLEKITQMEVRVTVLGHLQRGGSPTAYDRNLGTRFGTEAVHLLMKGMFGRMVSLRGESIESVTLDEAVGQLRKVSCDDPLVRGGRALRISFGDCS